MFVKLLSGKVKYTGSSNSYFDGSVLPLIDPVSDSDLSLTVQELQFNI